MKTMFCLVLPLASVLYLHVSAAPAEDEIINLPGIPSPPPTFKQYSGYLDSIGDIHLHYWFVESQSNASSDPVVLWLNGGPGCSSVFGFLSENGPFHVNIDGNSLYNNNHSWNQIANVLYLESPGGVGFSYSDSGNTTTDDNQTAAENYAAIKSFFEKFPEYRDNEFFITGESYGGIYVPTLSVLVVADDEINFKGFAIGNGMHSFAMNDQTSLINEMFGESVNLLLMILIAYMPSVAEAYESIGTVSFDPYYIYNECPLDSRSMFIAERLHYRFRKGNKTQILEKMRAAKKLHGGVATSNNPDCYVDTSVPAWLNQDSVRTALHIPSNVSDWAECSDLQYTITYENTAPLYENLLSKVRAMLYNGDADTVCNYLHGQYFAESLHLQVKEHYQAWNMNDWTVGFVKVFTNLTFVTVMNSGHMVPTNQPGPAFELFKNFILDEPFVNNGPS